MDSSSSKNHLKKLSEISGDTKKMEDLLSRILSAMKTLDKSQDDTEDDVEELDKSIDYLSTAITKTSPVDIAKSLLFNGSNLKWHVVPTF